MKINRCLAPFFIIAALLIIGCNDNEKPEEKQKEDNNGPVDLTQWDDELKAIIGRMSLEQKVGQTSQVTYQTLLYGPGPSQVWSDNLGSVILNAGIYPLAGNNPTEWVKELNLYQKEAMGTLMKIPLLFGIDAVHGHNSLTDATIFPHNAGMGAIAVGDLEQGLDAAKTAGRITAEEMLATGIHWTFSPQLTVARDVRWGRAYESFGENADIVIAMGKAVIQALQANGVAACAKHYGPEGLNQYGLNATWGQAGSSTEKLTADQIESVLLPYRAAIEAGVFTIMPTKSYYNGSHVHRSSELLTKALREDLGFKGFVISDWMDEYLASSPSETIAYFRAGTDMLMYGNQLNYPNFITAMTNAVKNGTVAIERLDEAVLRILRVKKAMGLLERGYKPPTESKQIGTTQNRAEARKIAAKALTLMINKQVNGVNALDILKNADRILITGQSANSMAMQCGGWTHGWQEGNIPTKGTTIADGIKNKVGESKVTLANSGENSTATTAITGTYDAIIAVIGDGPHAEDDGDRGRSNNATIPLRVGGGSFNSAAGNWNDVGLLNALYTYKAANPNVPLIVLMLSGRPMSINADAANGTPHMDQWDAFVVGWLPGSETGDAVADVLFGENDFVGRSPYTWRTSYATVPGYYNVGTYPETSRIIYGYGHGLKKDGTPCICTACNN